MRVITIENGIVTNLILCDSLEIAKEVTKAVCVEQTDELRAVDKGWLYENGTFSKPPAPPVEPPSINTQDEKVI